MATSVHANSLSPLLNHPSPYLAMHANDPVNWQLWSKDTLLQAQQQNKLIFMSSGYFSCHWCHVMQKENYQNPMIAEILNQHFISVKIDRELTPDIDRQMIDFARQHLGQAGWPQHTIALPSGEMIAGFTYLPKSDLQNYLLKLSSLWQTQAPALTTLPKSKKTPEAKLLWTNIQSNFTLRIQEALAEQMDDFSGGLKETNKFPHSPLIKTLLQQKNLNDETEDWIQLTLQQMQNEHLFDHVNGGFYRYVIDPEWQTPHFEKMLYDNAQLLDIYLLAYSKWKNPRYLQTAEATLAYIRDQLFSERLNLYLGSQSALDQNGEEGGSYLWSERQLKQGLNQEEFSQVKHDWQITSTPPYSLGWHPKPTRKYWPKIQQKLKQARIDSIPTDDKAILAWNGLLLSAFNTALNIPKKARANLNYLSNVENYHQQLAQTLIQMIQTTPARAYVFKDQLHPLNSITLSDYVYVLPPLKPYMEAKAWLRLVSSIRQFHNHGWSYTSDLSSQQISFSDDAVPSISVLAKCLVGSEKVSPKLLESPLNYVSYLQLNQCLGN